MLILNRTQSAPYLLPVNAQFHSQLTGIVWNEPIIWLKIDSIVNVSLLWSALAQFSN